MEGKEKERNGGGAARRDGKKQPSQCAVFAYPFLLFPVLSFRLNVLHFYF